MNSGNLTYVMPTEASVGNDSWVEMDSNTTEYYYYDYEEDPYEKAIDLTQFYLFGIIICIGLVVNTLAIICFLMSQNLRRTTTSHYLIALTVADNIFLIGEFLRWLNTLIPDEPYLGITFTDDFNFWCKIMFFLRYFGKLISAWITVLITSERYVSVAYPLQASQISTKRNCHIALAVIFTIGCAMTLFPFWTIGIITWQDWTFCSYFNQHEYNIWNWVVNRVASLLLPAIIIFIFTPMILYKLAKMNKQRKALVQNQRNSKSSKIQHQLNLMLVCVAVSFLLLRVPYCVAYYLYDFRHSIWNSMSDVMEQRLWVANKLTAVLATSNFTINFFLYCMVGSAFRSQFVALYCCKMDKLKRKPTVSIPRSLSTSAYSIRSLASSINSIISHHKSIKTSNNKVNMKASPSDSSV